MPGPGMPPQGAAPQGAPQGAAPQAPKAPQAPQQGGGAAQVFSMVGQGIAQIEKLMMGAGPAVTAQDKQLFGQLKMSFQALTDALQHPPGQGAPAAPRPGGPMPVNASPKGPAQPANYTG